ncbi:MAG: tRNA (guanosine(37)-N1)-methyltransferase TrmD, partial [Candidatus Cloacimonas sp. 4484_143]
MKIDVLTLFPQMFENFLKESMVGIAIKQKALSVELTDIRDFAFNKHHKVDDYPYGGGSGMVMTPEPLYEAIT